MIPQESSPHNSKVLYFLIRSPLIRHQEIGPIWEVGKSGTPRYRAPYLAINANAQGFLVLVLGDQ